VRFDVSGLMLQWHQIARHPARHGNQWNQEAR
jgi:hypothetical protein